MFKPNKHTDKTKHQEKKTYPNYKKKKDAKNEKEKK